GRVVTTGLSSDAGMVEMRVYIDPVYTPLIRERTCFWETSGVSFKLGLKDGIQIGFDSPEALLSGSIALATPPGAGEPVATGHRFPLHSEAKDDWALWQPGVPVGETVAGLQLPRPQATTIAWKRDTLLMRTRSHRGWTLPVRGGLLGPASLLRADKSAKSRSLAIEVVGGNYLVTTPPVWEERGIALLPLDLPPEIQRQAWAEARMRAPVAPEDSVLVADAGGEPMAIAASRIAVRGDAWDVDRSLAIDASWHGAAVVARSDGALIGIFMIDGTKPIIAPLSAPEKMFAGMPAPPAAATAAPAP
ncbi:MAG: hypothetical protein H0W83_09385, partial [Planctomycetes bacterium]|nr:hypothetical protein [Planctomycetota bacterium]